MATSNADIVNEWFRSRLSSGPLARSTDGHNQLVDALPALIADLDAAAKPAKGGARAAAKTTTEAPPTTGGAAADGATPTASEPAADKPS